MKFTLLRQLTHSELGMFHEYRRQGREGSKQRAINFDGEVVDRVFPSAKDSDRINIGCVCLEDETTVVETKQWLKKQDKNWRFEGICPRNKFYGFVEPGVLFAMVVDASVTPASAAWVVLPKSHPARNAILNHAESHRLGESSMVALHGEEGRFSQEVLAKHYPQLFEGGDMTRKVAKKAGRGAEAPPDPAGLFNILARAGHSLPSAVADLVDNSLSAGANNIDITFPNPNQGGRWMCIRDDGVGMTAEHLLTAMEIGHQRDYASPDLGKFGYGLKGAAWSQADRLTVVSKAANAQQSVRTWDRDHLAKTHRWELLTDPVDTKYASAVALGKTGTQCCSRRCGPRLSLPRQGGWSHSRRRSRPFATTSNWCSIASLGELCRGARRSSSGSTMFPCGPTTRWDTR